ncbi:MAG: hypothetical protein IJ711_09465 [Lachnospiraceae bacterium]|nr:hypothetical protein [Lachnospiraceae bacterium]
MKIAVCDDEKEIQQQISDNQKHMEQIEVLYADMRAFRHDMGNHVTVLEPLIRQEADDDGLLWFDLIVMLQIS